MIRNLYEQLRNKVRKEHWIPAIEWESFRGHDGIPVPASDVQRTLNIRLQDEHLSPFVKTDLNLFQMHMLDESVKIVIYKASRGWLMTFDGVAEGPKPFGQDGYDTR